MIKFFEHEDLLNFFLLNGLLACLMRNNMIYVLILFFITLLLFLLLKKASQKIIKVNYILIMTFYVIQLIFYVLCHFGQSPIGETLCVPINQISYVYVNRNINLSYEEKQKIIAYIPKARDYNPRLVDPVKKNFNQKKYNTCENEFWELYLTLLKKYPLDYIKSFLNINLPYWFIAAKFPDPYSQKQYIETSDNQIRNVFPILEKQNYIKPLNDYYESFSNFSNKIMKMFPLNLFFSLSFPFLSLILCLYVSIKQKIYGAILVYILYLLLLFTYILGPVSNFRYIYTFYLCLPLYFGIIFKYIKKLGDEEF